jgi:hypothetical protein
MARGANLGSLVSAVLQAETVSTENVAHLGKTGRTVWKVSKGLPVIAARGDIPAQTDLLVVMAQMASLGLEANAENVVSKDHAEKRATEARRAAMEKMVAMAAMVSTALMGAMPHKSRS